MPKVIETDDVEWEMDSANPAHVDVISLDPGHSSVRRVKPGLIPRHVPCVGDALQLTGLLGGVVGVTTYLATSRVTLARNLALATGATTFTVVYALCYHQYRRRLAFEYRSDLFRKGREDEYITEVVEVRGGKRMVE